MSIITKRGDAGYTDKLFGGKVRKSSPLIEAIGNIDELNAWIGLAAKGSEGNEHELIQKDLVSIMGELSAGSKWFEQYKSQFGAIGEDRITSIEEIVKKLEVGRKFVDWANPSSHWDVACRVCRRAERSLYQYHDDEGKEGFSPVRTEVFVYINRLSDLLWILGRK